jgi:PAS domain-containing protein
MPRRGAVTPSTAQGRVKAAKQALAVLSAAFDGASAAVSVKDRGGRYVMLNPAAGRFLGKPLGGAIGKRDTQILPPQEAHRLMEVDRSVLQTGRPAS